MTDYIDREALLKAISKVGGSPLSEWDTVGVVSLVVNQPAADVKPFLRAEWIPYKGGTVCGSCAKGLKRTYGPNDVFMDLSEMPYCPNCGADMREVPNDD